MVCNTLITNEQSRRAQVHNQAMTELAERVESTAIDVQIHQAEIALIRRQTKRQQQCIEQMRAELAQYQEAAKC